MLIRIMIIHHNIEQRLAEECKMCVRIFAKIGGGGGSPLNKCDCMCEGWLVGLQVASILKLIQIWQKNWIFAQTVILVQRNSETLRKP